MFLCDVLHIRHHVERNNHKEDFMPYQMKKILYTTDLSPAAPRVFQYAIFLANQFDAHVTSMHVLEELSPDAKFAIALHFSDGDAEEMMRKKQKEAKEEMFQRVETLCQATTLSSGEYIDPDRLTIRVERGFPEEKILSVSKEIGADIIVMGAHEKGFTHTFLGSVAKRVLRRSKIPVVIVPLTDE